MTLQTRSALRDQPCDEPEPSVITEFESRVEENPERTALKIRSRETSYGTLNALANQFGRGMTRCFDVERPIVALLFEQGEEQIAAMLGALKAGLIYVPLDPTYPKARLDQIFADAGAGLLVASHRNAALAAELAAGSCQVVLPDEFASQSDANLGRRVLEDELAYILYTSGSTGEPKGVTQNHRNLLFLATLHGNDLALVPEDGLTFLYSYSFSAGVKDLFGGLLAGATLYPIDLKEVGFAGLAAILAEEGITIYHSVPSVFREMCLNLGAGADLDRLRLISLSGEPVTSVEVRLFQEHFPAHCRLHIYFGTTETGNIGQLFLNRGQYFSEGEALVGYPVDGKDISVQDEEGGPVPAGEVGLLTVTSRYLSPGYWRRPDLTRAAFRNSPGDDGADLSHG